MSYQDVQNAIKNETVKNPTDRHVLAILAYHQNPKYGCFPGEDLIAKETGYDRRTVIRSIKRLEATGTISAVHGRGRGNSNRYALNLEKVTQSRLLAGNEPKEKGDFEDRKGDTESP
jgi:DNA-binding MarR family transcriptional regulator